VNATNDGAPLRPALALRLVLPVLLVGCASSQIFVTPKLSPALAGITVPLKHFSARVNGPLLEIEVRSPHRDDEYQANFDLEVAIAAAVCAALSRNQDVFELDWDVLALTLSTQYGHFGWHTTAGWFKVKLGRETLQRLGAAGAAASDYSALWQHRYGWKSGPAGAKLEWNVDDPEPHAVSPE
jgi:hypothetical protein